MLLDQATWFQRQGYDVHAAFYYDKDGLLDTWRRQSSFPIHVVGSYQKGQPLKNGLGLINGFIALYKLIRKLSPQIIECFTHDANLLGIPAAWLCGVPVRVGSHHCTYQGLTPAKIKIHTLMTNSRLCSAIAAVSKMSRQQALDEKIRPEKIEIIPNGIAPLQTSVAIRAEKRAELGLKPDDIFILNVARMVPEKSQRLLIEAAGILLEANPNLRFMIAGDGPLRAQLTAQVEALGLQNRFWLPGKRTDVPALMNAADIFSLYSEIEGMPLSLMEAMSARLAVAASAIQANRDLVEDGVSGLLIPFGDAKLLAAAIQRLVDNPLLREELGQHAEQVITQQFTIEKSCRAYEALFDRLLKNRSESNWQ